MSTMYPSKKKVKLASTRLWTNSSPKSNFGAQTVTLSQDMDNFDYLEIVAKEWKDKTEQQAISYIFSIPDVKTCTSAKSIMNMGIIGYAESYGYTRYIKYVSDTQISFSTSYRNNNAASNNAGMIPLYINGLKF